MIDRIKHLAEDNGLNIASLEREVGLANGSIRRWSGSPPSIDKVAKVASALNSSLDYLYFGTESHNLSNDKQELLNAYNYLSEEGRKWVRHFITDYLKREEKISYSQFQEDQQSRGGSA